MNKHIVHPNLFSKNLIAKKFLYHCQTSRYADQGGELLTANEYILIKSTACWLVRQSLPKSKQHKKNYLHQRALLRFSRILVTTSPLCFIKY